MTKRREAKDYPTKIQVSIFFTEFQPHPTSQNILIQMKAKILPGSSTAIVLIHQIDLELLALKWQGSSSVQALSTIIGRKPGAKSGLPVKFD
jgi:hypothetical protein